MSSRWLLILLFAVDKKMHKESQGTTAGHGHICDHDMVYCNNSCSSLPLPTSAILTRLHSLSSPHTLMHTWYEYLQGKIIPPMGCFF
jgi:hypothetical protein